MSTFPRLMNFLENKMVNPDLATALIGFKDNIMADYYKKWAPETNVPESERFTVEFEEGSKYVKVVSLSWGSRSVHSFVEKKTGDIWKAASWKAPARNFSRGNVFDAKSYLPRVSWTGVV
jgi:hypothetical protein